MGEMKNDHQSAGERGPELEELLSRPMRANDLPLRVWTLRIDESVACEIEGLARLKRMSVNAFVVTLFDQSLRQNGCPSVQELAPDFLEYLRRKGRRSTPDKSRRSSEFDPFGEL